jgi:hypothetical protein
MAAVTVNDRSPDEVAEEVAMLDDLAQLPSGDEARRP